MNEQERRRWRLISVVERLARDNDVVAGVIEQTTGAKVSERTVQAWLIAPGRKSSRNCPEWAVKALEDYVADPANRELLETRAARLHADLTSERTPLAWSDEVRKNKAVEFATAALEEEARTLRMWQDVAGLELGKMLWERERRQDAEMTAQMRTLTAIHEAFRTSSTFDDWKSKFQEFVRASELQNFAVRQAKRAIESSSEEFAAPDAVIQQPRAPQTK